MHGIIDLDPTEITIVANNAHTGIAGTQYYNCSITDKGVAITHILQDIIDDFIRNNADRIRNFLMDEGNDDVDEEDGEVEL